MKIRIEGWSGAGLGYEHDAHRVDDLGEAASTDRDVMDLGAATCGRQQSGVGMLREAVGHKHGVVAAVLDPLDQRLPPSLLADGGFKGATNTQHTRELVDDLGGAAITNYQYTPARTRARSSRISPLL